MRLNEFMIPNEKDLKLDPEYKGIAFVPEDKESLAKIYNKLKELTHDKSEEIVLEGPNEETEYWFEGLHALAFDITDCTHPKSELAGFVYNDIMKPLGKVQDYLLEKADGNNPEYNFTEKEFNRLHMCTLVLRRYIECCYLDVELEDGRPETTKDEWNAYNSFNRLNEPSPEEYINRLAKDVSAIYLTNGVTADNMEEPN